MARTIGTIQCHGLDCGEKVAVTETAGASLACKCAFCGFSSYAPPGTKSARRIRMAMQTFDDGGPVHEPAPAPKAATPPPKTPKPVSNVFDLAQHS